MSNKISPGFYNGPQLDAMDPNQEYGAQSYELQNIQHGPPPVGFDMHNVDVQRGAPDYILRQIDHFPIKRPWWQTHAYQRKSLTKWWPMGVFFTPSDAVL